MKKINLGITGCVGVWVTDIKSVRFDKNLSCCTHRKKDLIKNKYKISNNLTFKKTDLIIDFTTPNVHLRFLKTVKFKEL